MQLQTTTPNGIPAMSSLEISKLTGKRHDNVMRDIESVLKEAEIDLLKFEEMTSNSSGHSRKCYMLPKMECDLVISGYSVKYRLAIIKRWHELEAQAAKPLSKLERLRAEYAEAVKQDALSLAHAAITEANDAIKPQHEYGSIAPDGRPRIGMRRAAFVVTRARVDEAIRLMEGQLYYQDQLNELLGQTIFPFDS